MIYYAGLLFGTTCRKKFWFMLTSFWSPWRRRSNVLWSTSFGRPRQRSHFFASCGQHAFMLPGPSKKLCLLLPASAWWRNPGLRHGCYWISCRRKPNRSDRWSALFHIKYLLLLSSRIFRRRFEIPSTRTWLATAIAECAMQVNMDGERSGGIQIKGRLLMAKVHAEDMLWTFVG